MSNTILVMGRTGVGKSHSLQYLKPEETCIINILGKPLPFRGFKRTYTEVGKRKVQNEDGNEIVEYFGNYFCSMDNSMIMALIKSVNENRRYVKNLIIDDFQFTMSSEYFMSALEKEKGKAFDKFARIGQNAWNIMTSLMQCRDDLNCFVLSHTDVTNEGIHKFKTIGKMLDNYAEIESMFTVVLHALVIDGKNVFATRSDGIHVAKSPVGMFEDFYIDNNLQYVKEKIQQYNEGEEDAI